MKRITRILDQQPDSRRTVGWGFSTLLSVTVLALGAGVAHATTTDAVPSEPTAFEWTALATTTPKDEKEYRQIEARLLEAVAAGDLSVEEAQKTLAALRKNMLGGGKDKAPAKSKAKGEKKDSVDGAVKKLKDAVAAGKISKEEAVKKRKALEEFQAAEKKKKEADKKDDAREKKFAAVERKLEEAVKAGKLSKEEAYKKLAEVKRDLWGEKKDLPDTRSEESVKRRYLDAEKKIKAAIDAGKISPAEGKKKLEAFKKDLGAQARADAEPSRYRRLEQAAGEIRKAAAEGKLGREEAAKRIEDIRRQLGRVERADRAEALERRRRTGESAGEVERRRRNGDAVADLESLGREIEGESRRRTTRTREVDPRKGRYEEIEAKLEAAVKSGDLSKEDAEKKLIEIRRDMFRTDHGEVERRPRSTRETDRADRSDRLERTERTDRVERRVRGERESDRADGPDRLDRKVKPDSDPVKQHLDAAKKKLMAAVEAGKMTEEEAKQVYDKLMIELAGKRGEEAEKKGRVRRR